MNIASSLPKPFSDFVVDVEANHYYDFQLPSGSEYPLAGVKYPVDYGHIPGYTTEDNADLDLFVGNYLGDNAGYIVVDRGEIAPSEHKFYVSLTEEELAIILDELKPVLLSHRAFENITELMNAVESYKNKL